MAFRKRVRRTTEPAIDPADWALLHDRLPDPGEGNKFAINSFERRARRLWDQYGSAVLRQWVREKPGTRPLCWWHFDCPIAIPKSLKIPRHHNEWAVGSAKPPGASAQRKFLQQHQLLQEGEK